MPSLAHHALLVLSVLAIGLAALRIASRAAGRGLERAVAAAVIGGALVVAWPLALAPLGLSGSSVVLAAGALATWAGARLLLAAPAIRVRDELAGGWTSAGAVPRMLAGALVALAAGWIAWQLRHPYLAVDGVLYHLSLSGAWVQNGHAGSIVNLIEGLPVANYPITNEVALTWGIGLSRSFVVASMWTVLLMVLLGASAWLGLRELRVPREVAALAIVAFLTLPIVATQSGAPLTDVAAVSWLTACVALCAVSRRVPALLPVALLAAALSFGTKTTGTVLALAALGWAAWSSRAQLRPLARPLGIAAGAGLLVGGLWTVRNVVDHGSPLWPFAATSFGDPVPATLTPFSDSFLSHPKTMLSGRVDDYARTLAGGLLLLAGPLLALVFARTRAVLALAGLSGLAVLVWSLAPYTGIDETQLAIGATRYLMPALACATVTIAVAARDASPAGRSVLTGVLALAALISAARTWQLGFPVVPSAGTVLGLLVLGAVGAAAAAWVRLPRLPAAVLAGTGAAAVIVVLSVASNGYVARHTQSSLPDAGVLAAMLALPDADTTIGMGPTSIALLRGDGLDHRLDFVAADSPCADVRRRAEQEVLILQKAPVTPAYTRLAGCLGGLAPRYSDGGLDLYGG